MPEGRKSAKGRAARMPLIEQWQEPAGRFLTMRISSCPDGFDTSGDGVYCN